MAIRSALRNVKWPIKGPGKTGYKQQGTHPEGYERLFGYTGFSVTGTIYTTH